LPSVPRIAAEPTATRQTVERREGLPSSRFAHSQPHNMSDRALDDRAAPLHSGEGYISGTGRGQPHESYRGPSTLPQAPQIQPDVNREQRIDTSSRRFDRGNDPMRMPERSASQPTRAEPMRQNYQPRYEPAQRTQEFRPQPRAESHEQRSESSHGESHSSGHAASGGREDSHGH
jgi:hypothetical protein